MASIHSSGGCPREPAMGVWLTSDSWAFLAPALYQDLKEITPAALAIPAGLPAE
ncbi:MAG: hypothetical protein V2A76_07455 [Planctomycetota bacterium]